MSAGAFDVKASRSRDERGGCSAMRTCRGPLLVFVVILYEGASDASVFSGVRRRNVALRSLYPEQKQLF